jgi:hypothetical protein
MKKISLFVACILFTCLGVAAGDDFKAIYISDSVNVDGILNDEAWTLATPISEFTQFEPVYNAPSRYNTSVKVLYNDRMIYFAFTCSDPEIEKITAKITKRDDNLPRDDGVVVFLDTFHDRSNSYFFAVNPIGTQSDGRFSDNGRTSDVEWDTSWESGAKIGPTGWTAEFGIPFEVLKFNAQNTVWGFNAERRVARSLERSFWARDLTAMFRVSQFGTLSNLNLKSLSIKRYTIIPYSQFQFQKGEKYHDDYGVDARLKLSSNFGIEGTVNPDFATIESDVEQVNLTRFELSYPEKRPFFLEGAEDYSTRIRQFYSRRIGEIPWGIKINGKLSDWNVNALTTSSDPASAGADVEDGYEAVYSVFRIGREIRNGSNVGVIGANRSYREKDSGSLGLVSTLFFTDYLGMTNQIIKSWGEVDNGTWAYFFRPAYDSQFTHFHVRYTHIGEGIMENMNSTGYIRDDDRREIDTELEKTFWINRLGIESISPGINYNRYWSLTGELRRWEDINSLSMKFLKKWKYSIRHIEEYIRYEKGFRNGYLKNEVEYDNKLGTSLFFEYAFGKNYDRDLEQFGGGIDLKMLEGWTVIYNFSRYWFRPAKPDDNSWIHFVRSTYYVTNDLYFKVFYQTKHRIEQGLPHPELDLLKQNLQIVFVWRFIPPFGSVQVAYQEGSSQFFENDPNYKSLLLKLAWVL